MSGRPRTSLDRVLRDPPTDRDDLMDLRREVYRVREFITLTPEEVERMPGYLREGIKSEARRILGRRT